jgi:cytochrome c553
MAMKRLLIVLCVVFTITGVMVADDQMPQPPRGQQAPARAQTPAATAPVKPAVAHKPAGLAPDAENQIVKQYCVGCHNEKGKAGGLSLASFDAAQMTLNADVGEKMIRKLRAGMMPPPGVRRPDADTVKAFYASLESAIDTAAAVHPSPGWRPFQRLNRVEYAAAVRDLLGFDVDVNAFLPPDTMSGGFDNIADVQSFSPQLMEGYLRAASQISRLAIGDRDASPTSVTFKIRRDRSQMVHVDGAPMGTRGGVSTVHVFPADGDYTIKVSFFYSVLGQLFGRYSIMTMGFKEQVDVSVNGERVALLDVSPAMTETDFGQNKGLNGMELRTPPIHIKAGPQRISAAFLQRLDGPADDLVAPIDNTAADVDGSYGATALPHLREMTILGPNNVTGVSETVSRRRVFTCRPVTANEEETCAAQIVKNLTAKAYRGEATSDDVQDAMEFYERGRKDGDFESGVRMALQSILISPRFLFRLEDGPVTVKAASQTFRISDQDLASRLSFFLWGTGPDADVIKAADGGVLRTAAGLDKVVRRMLADPRSEALSTRFASQWFRLQDLDKIQPDYTQFPQFDHTLELAMQRETELFFDSLVREDHNVLDLLTADYSFVNERLAKHYNIPNVAGSAFRRVQLPAERRGLLGEGSILTLTSVADRTSPVLRGKWVMEVLLGTPPPPPPPNVPALDDSVTATAGGKQLTTRERMEEHRKSPACASCHRVMDPLGLALDNFDVTGAWRIKENGLSVDVSGDLYDGTKVDGPAGLREALLRHSDMVLRSFTENLLTYALGRRLEYSDMPTVRAIVNGAAKSDNRMSSFILGVVNSPAFRTSKAENVPSRLSAESNQK